MASTRTQIYLTADQRSKLEDIRKREHRSLAELIRDAIDSYLADRGAADLDEALKESFGSIPDLEVPSRDEWDRGYG